MNILTRYCLDGVHPDDLRAAVNAKLKQRLMDAKRNCRKEMTSDKVEEDMFLASVASGPLADWPVWLRMDVIDYAVAQGGAEFFIKLGKALKKGKGVLFDVTDIFILRNWRVGHNLQGKTRAEAVKILREAKFLTNASLDEYAKQTYGSRIKRLGLTQRRR